MRVKSQKGSIAIFVLVALLFYMAFLLLLYANNLNKVQTITEKVETLKSIYAKNVENIDEVYNRKKGVQIGDYVNYDPTPVNEEAITTYTSYAEANASSDKNDGRSSGYTSDQVFNLSSYTGGWRVLGIEDGKIQLISADIIGPDTGGYTSGSNKYYYLRGQKGYINGEAELNAISSMYGQGKYATGARSINVDDINKITGYNPASTGNGKPYNSGAIDEYKNKVTYSWEDGKVAYSGTNGKSGTSTWTTFNYYDESSRDFVYLESNETKELTDTYYYYYPTTLTTSSSGDTKGIARTSNIWKLLFENTDSKYYWLASPYVCTGEGFATFGFNYVKKELVDSYYAVYVSTTYIGSYYYGIRPVVTLNSNVKLVKDTATDTWNIQ